MANSGPFKPKQLVDINLVTEYGGIELTPEFMNEGNGRLDYLYVPGASDDRIKRDEDLSRFHRGEIKASEVKTLEWNARWYRCAAKSGDPDQSRPTEARNEGYRPATKADIGSSWLKELPPRGIIAPDGTIRNSGGDLQLFVTDREHAAKNAWRKKIRTEQSVDGMQFENGGLGSVGKKMGVEAFVMKETNGTQPKGATK